MSNFSGTLELVDLEGGLWQLHTEHQTYVLDFGESTIDPSAEHGDNVKISGIAEETIGIAMMGLPTLVVSTFTLNPA